MEKGWFRDGGMEQGLMKDGAGMKQGQRINEAGMEDEWSRDGAGMEKGLRRDGEEFSVWIEVDRKRPGWSRGVYILK